MGQLAIFFTKDHHDCDAQWANVEAAAESGDNAAASQAFAAFDRDMRHHLGMEEDILFPAFEQATGMMGGPTQVMRAEHRQMRALLDEMGRAMEAGDPDLALDHGDTLLMLIQQHNVKEEGMLYPMAEQALGGNWDELLPMFERYTVTA